MEEKQRKATGLGEYAGAIAPFILGLVVALAIGWWLFPELMFWEEKQPADFKHASHEMLECTDCHFLRADGSFSGVPGTEDCASCHSDAQGDSQAEAEFIEKYVVTGTEPAWLIHQKQPDNVFFSHAAHSLATCQQMGCHSEWESDSEVCTKCHPSVEDLDKPVAYKENWLTGYSNSTMKMWECERCHANPNHGDTTANNACFTCHK